MKQGRPPGWGACLTTSRPGAAVGEPITGTIEAANGTNTGGYIA
jgi:hypothetical protein